MLGGQVSQRADGGERTSATWSRRFPLSSSRIKVPVPSTIGAQFQ